MDDPKAESVDDDLKVAVKMHAYYVKMEVHAKGARGSSGRCAIR
jgi:hypothetical protein